MTQTQQQVARPYNSYNIFFILERELVIRSRNGRLGAQTDADDFGGYEGLEIPPLPPRYQVLGQTLAPNWYAPGLRKHVKRKHTKSEHGVVSFKEIPRIVAENWKSMDDPTGEFVEAVATALKKRYAQLPESRKERPPTGSPKAKKSRGRKRKGDSAPAATAVGANIKPPKKRFARRVSDKVDGRPSASLPAPPPPSLATSISAASLATATSGASVAAPTTSSIPMCLGVGCENYAPSYYTNGFLPPPVLPDRALLLSSAKATAGESSAFESGGAASTPAVPTDEVDMSDIEILKIYLSVV